MTNKNDWQLQEAKAMFSNLIKASAKKPQVITVRGKETAVVISIDKYKKLVKPEQSLFQFLQSSPLCGINLELPERLPENPREIIL